MKIIRVILLLTINMLLALSAMNSSASTYGKSCALLPLEDETNYLVQKTAYGFIQKHIDMQTYVTDAKNACKAEGEEFKFCLRNGDVDEKLCTKLTMRKDVPTTISKLLASSDSTILLPDIKLTVKVIGNKLCLTMNTSRGVMPLMCREKGSDKKIDDESESDARICRFIGTSCYEGGKKSQSLFNFSGLTINCLRETLNKLFYGKNDCATVDSTKSVSMLSKFSDFQESMKRSVMLALIIYVIFYGFNLAMNIEYASFNKVAMFVIKFIFVIYFSIGLGSKEVPDNGVTDLALPLLAEMTSNKEAPSNGMMDLGRSLLAKMTSTKEVHHNGMTELALPLLVEMTSNFAEIVFLAGGSQGLCVFNSDNYKEGYEYYKIWDAIDCRIAYYLGMQVMYNIGGMLKNIEGHSSISKGDEISWKGGDDGIDALDQTGSFSFFPIMFGFFLSGNILIVIFGLVFVVMLLSLLLYFMTAYLVSMVTLYAMAYVSPIFVPMLLFERTKGYFDSWLKIVISCALQPAVIAGFVALLLTMYDSAIYGNCEFQRHDYVEGNSSFSTFELRLPNSDPEKCKASLGYKLMQYYSGYGWEDSAVVIFAIYKIHDSLDMFTSMLYVMIFMLIFYFFIKSVSEFASDLTGGVSVGSVVVSPTALVDKAIAAASIAKEAMSGNAKKAGSGAGKAAKSADSSSTKGD